MHLSNVLPGKQMTIPPVVTNSEWSDEMIQVALKLQFKYTLHHIHPC